MVDLKGIEPSTSRMRTERSPKLSYKPEYMCQEKRFEQTQLNRDCFLYRFRSQLSESPECQLLTSNLLIKPNSIRLTR